MTEYFRLTSSEDQYVEFVFGADSFILEFKYNPIDERYYLNVYKNNLLVIQSLKLVWCYYNIFNSYKYKNLGSLSCVSSEFNISSANNVTQELQELTKSNLTKFVFEWVYDSE